MEILSPNQATYVFGMPNLTPKRTGLKTQIWVDHNGVSRNVAHRYTPRVKVGPVNEEVPVLIDKNPKILIDESSIKHNLLKDVQSTFSYISRNEDILKRFYFDTIDDFDEKDLEDELARRGDF